MPTIQEFLQGLIPGLPVYPTKEAILAEPMPTHKPAVIALTKQWKREVWKISKSGSPEQRFEALKTLLNRIAVEHYQKPVEVVYSPGIPSCAYNQVLNRIMINESLSIISSLHELAHHLFGPDETKACRWSVHLFKKTFPKAYAGLEWRGHTLIKPRCSVS